MAEVTVRVRKGVEIREEVMDVDLDGVDFLFGEGNYACDCNRGIFFGDYDADTPNVCGEDIYAVEVIHDGKVIYSDF